MRRLLPVLLVLVLAVTSALLLSLSFVSTANADLTVVATVPVGQSPTGVAYDSGTGEVFVTNIGGDTVSVISDVTNTVVATVPVGSGPTGVAYDSGTGEVFVTNLLGNTVSVISDVTNTVVATVPVGTSPTGVAYDSGTGEVFVANVGGNTVSVISDVTTFVVATVPVGGDPAGVAYDNGKGEVFVANDGNNDVSVISDGTTSLHTTSTTLGCTPSTVVVNQATSCTATVTDTATGPTTPTGTVTFTPSGTCILGGLGDSATCSADVTPTETGTLSVSATYGGDATHQSSSGFFTISVNPGALSVSFTVSANPTVGSPVTFTATVSGGTAPYTFSWDFGDMSAAGTGNPVTHTYASSGAKTVTLLVTDANGFGAPDDTWEFSGGVWTQLSPSSSPPPRQYASMAYDAADGYVLLFGGVHPTVLCDACTWDFSAGTQTSTFRSPPPPLRATMLVDDDAAYVLLLV